VESSLWPYSIIAENNSLVRRKKPHVKKSGKMPIKGIGLMAWQKIRIAMALLDQ